MIFGFFSWNIFSFQWITHVGMKDSWIFKNSIYLNLCITFKDFWTISLEILFKSRDNDSCRNQGFLDFCKILSIKLLASNSRIFGFFHLKYFFSPVNDLCQNQGFLDLFKILSIKLLTSNSRIFGFFHLKYFFSPVNYLCLNQRFLD